MPDESKTELRAVAALSAASFAVIGACLTLPGTLLPLLVKQFEMRLVEAGSMIALQSVAYLFSVQLAARLLQRFGMRRVLSTSVLLFALGVGGFGLTSSWIAGAAMLFASGLGFGVMEVAVNTLLIGVGGARSSNLLNFTHLFFGVGCFIAPALTAHAVTAGLSWRIPFLAAGLVTALVSLGWYMRLTDAAAPAVPPAAAASRSQPRVAVVLAVLLGLYVGNETGIGAWLTKYMMSARQVSLPYAGNTLSLYWLGLAAGRLVLSGAAHRTSEERLLVVLSAFSTLAMAGGILAGDSWLAALCFAGTGLGFSGIFPAVIALGGRLQPHRTAAVTSVLITGAGIGGIVIPWTMSAIADGAGLVAGMSFYVATTAAMIALALLARRGLDHVAAADAANAGRR